MSHRYHNADRAEVYLATKVETIIIIFDPHFRCPPQFRSSREGDRIHSLQASLPTNGRARRHHQAASLRDSERGRVCERVATRSHFQESLNAIPLKTADSVGVNDIFERAGISSDHVRARHHRRNGGEPEGTVCSGHHPPRGRKMRLSSVSISIGEPWIIIVIFAKYGGFHRHSLIRFSPILFALSASLTESSRYALLLHSS